MTTIKTSAIPPAIIETLRAWILSHITQRSDNGKRIIVKTIQREAIAHACTVFPHIDSSALAAEAAQLVIDVNFLRKRDIAKRNLDKWDTQREAYSLVARERALENRLRWESERLPKEIFSVVWDWAQGWALEFVGDDIDEGAKDFTLAVTNFAVTQFPDIDQEKLMKAVAWMRNAAL